MEHDEDVLQRVTAKVAAIENAKHRLEAAASLACLAVGRTRASKAEVLICIARVAAYSGCTEAEMKALCEIFMPKRGAERRE